ATVAMQQAASAQKEAPKREATPPAAKNAPAEKKPAEAKPEAAKEKDRSAELAPKSPVSPALKVIAWVGAITALFAASIAVAPNDIKRILAYSTVSQLGFMM